MANVDLPWWGWGADKGRALRCRQFIRRVKPQGYTVLCGQPVTHEFFAVHEDGREVYNGGTCAKHRERRLRGYGHADGWRIEIRERVG